MKRRKQRPSRKHPAKKRRPKLRLPAPAALRGHITATIDGAARGNPGPAAYGVVFEDAREKIVARLNGRIGATTNNVAEYRALLAALTYAREQGWASLRVRTDSELLARQIRGDYKVKSPDLKPLHAKASALITAFDYFAIESVPRSLTRAADRLANAALDGRSVPSVGGREKEKSGRGAAFIPTQEGHPHTIHATYQDGVLKPLAPLNLSDGEQVTLTIHRSRTK
ncbi:MAG: reverse transcriptase-like protein [Candidatus Acidiferrales bacterium]